MISEVQFFNDKNDKRAWDFVSGTGIDLNGPCESSLPTIGEIKKALVDFGLEVREVLNENNRIEISASQQGIEGLWLIFTDIKNENQQTHMFEVGRGSNPELIIGFMKSMAQTHGKFLYYCDSGCMTLITKEKSMAQIRKEIYS